MSKKLIISEEEQKEIKKLYNLSEQDYLRAGIESLLKNIFSKKKEDGKKPKDKESISSIDGKVKITGYSGDKLNNINIFIDEMNKMGITDPLHQIGILSVAAKESSFNSFKEKSYCSTPDNRIINVFGNKRGNRCKSLKCDDSKFFECVYGKNSGVSLGNNQTGDGAKFIGRGFNQITGRANYEKISRLTGLDLISNPSLLEDPRVAAKAAILYYTKGKSANSLPKFNDKKKSVEYFADLTSGSNSQRARENAFDKMDNFNIA